MGKHEQPRFRLRIEDRQEGIATVIDKFSE
jgi:hypothetical protein